MQLTTEVMIPQHILQTEKLDAIEKILYLHLYTAGTKVQTTYRELMQVAGIHSRPTLSKYLKKMQDKQLIVIEKNHTDKGFKMPSTYSVNKQPAYFLDATITANIFEKMQEIIGDCTCSFTDAELLELVQTAQMSYGVDAYRKLFHLCVRLESDEQAHAFATLKAKMSVQHGQDKNESAMEMQLRITFPNLNTQDRTTYERLCQMYPTEVVHYTLEKVAGKAKQANWAYITTMIRTLAVTCITYDDCVHSANRFFEQRKAEQKKAKQAASYKKKMIMRLIALGTFGEVDNPAGYAQKISRDPQYVGVDIFELFELLTGEHHLNAKSFDPMIYQLMYFPENSAQQAA